jgi:flagellar basal body-associated protein FliL
LELASAYGRIRIRIRIVRIRIRIIIIIIVIVVVVVVVMYSNKHTRRQYAFSSTQQVHSQQHSKSLRGHDRHRQAKHHKQTPHNTTPRIHPFTDVGTLRLALTLAPLDLANMPTDAR